MAWLRLVVAFAVIVAVCASAQAQIPRAKGKRTIDLGGMPVEVFTYRPRCPNPALLVVFHGDERSARGNRNAAMPIANKLCMFVVAPLFDREHFPSGRYQQGGITERGTVLPPNRWTAPLALGVVEWARQQERRRLPYAFIGHSAGGQFLSRVAAFVPNEARRIVIANPSSYVLPNLQVRAPFGLGGVFPGEAGPSALRRYLETPVTIFLGQNDDDPDDEHLSVTRDAMAQGHTRYDRGLNAFKQGMAMAAANKWRFNWRLIELPGVGHSSRRMFGSEQAIRALLP